MATGMKINRELKEAIERDGGQIKLIESVRKGTRSELYFIHAKSGKSYKLRKYHQYINKDGFNILENEYASLKTLSKYGFSPEVIYVDRNRLSLVSSYINGTDLKEFNQLERTNILLKSIETMAKIHSACSEHSKLFHREPNDLRKVIKMYEKYNGNNKVVKTISPHINSIIETLSSQKEHFILGDTFASNFVWNGEIKFIDAELCSKGPAVIDLAMFFSDLMLPYSFKLNLAKKYQKIKNQPKFMEAIDAATIYLDILTIAIYCDDLATSKQSPELTEKKRKKIDYLHKDIGELVSNSQFSKSLRGIRI